MTCVRCQKRVAVVFITRLEGDKTINEGLCLKCAKDLGIKPVEDIVAKMGLSEEDLETMSSQLAPMFGLGEESDEDFEPGGAATFPFMQNFLQGGGDAAEPDDEEPHERESEPERGDKRTAKSDKKEKRDKKEKKDKKRKYLDTYCDNLTKRAKEGKIDRIIGRDKEISRVIQILSRRQKNNPCLVGEAGVGKTAVAEAIALRIASGDVPFKLQDKELYRLDMTALVAGTQFRGQFESRVKGLIDEVVEAGNIILFIDEVHSIVGAGDAEGSMNAANLLKPALSRGEVQIIGATTFNEYRKNIEKDSALERRFQPVKVEEQSVEETAHILKGVKSYYENYHKVKISDSLIDAMVPLSERYITDRYLPDKAIDLLDEACAYASLRSDDLHEYERADAALADVRLEIEELTEESGEADDTDYQRLAELRADELRLTDVTDTLRERAQNVWVTEEDLARVIEMWTGIPASKVQREELQKIASLEGKLRDKIIGQDEAIALVAAAIKRSRVQISGRRRPASFIFVGPTGVGKTELVKVLASELFDTADPLIRLDMSEFMDKYSVSRIVGAPPGYVGYDEAGQLTEKVRRRPYSVVLFDEIEKAHPDVMNILLQILDEGRINDAHGRTVNFENTVIVMTSNAGSDRQGGALGFAKSAGDLSRDKEDKALKEFLRPEFISRVDEVVHFRPLTKDDYVSIARLMLEELRGPLRDRGIELRYDDDVLRALSEQSFGGRYGARDLRRVVRKDVEDRIVNLIVDHGSPNAITAVTLTVQDGKLQAATSH